MDSRGLSILQFTALHTQGMIWLGKRSGRIADNAKITTEWQRVEIPLSAFANYGVDLTHLAELRLAFEWEWMSGTVYLDDVQFGTSLH